MIAALQGCALLRTTRTESGSWYLVPLATWYVTIEGSWYVVIAGSWYFTIQGSWYVSCSLKN